MSEPALPYCDDLYYIRSGRKGDCIPRERGSGFPTTPEPTGGIITEIDADPIVATSSDLQTLIAEDT